MDPTIPIRRGRIVNRAIPTHDSVPRSRFTRNA
jgi:hypothetical protein